jgi:DNA repair protein RadD
MAALVTALSRLDLMTLERLAGATIVRAVREAYNTNRETELARLVVDRYGDTILKQREVRSCLVETLPQARAEKWCQELRLNDPNRSVFRSLLDYFESSFTPAKAEAFVAEFGLDSELIGSPAVDMRQASELVTVAFGEEVRLKGYLHPYQKRAKDDVTASILRHASRQMLQMPTGAGKTVTALEVVVDVLRRPDFNGLVTWIVDSSELAEQALQSFKELWRVRGDFPVTIHRLFGEFSPALASNEPGVVFAGFAKVHAALQSKDGTTRDRVAQLCKRNRLLIVDEAHHSIADTYEPIIRRLIDDGANLVGLSATPGSNSDVGQTDLARLFDSRLISLRDDSGRPADDAIAYLRRGGFLAHVDFVELSSGKSSAGTQESMVCEELAQNAERNFQIVEELKKCHLLGEPTVVFACTKEHVFALVALCRSGGLDVGFIVGETPPSQRIDMLERFRAGSLSLLINHEILSTGVDLPNVRRLVITRPVGSPILYSQMIGRALRGPRNGGNAKNTVINIRDNLLNFPSASFVYESFRQSFGH